MKPYEAINKDIKVTCGRKQGLPLTSVGLKQSALKGPTKREEKFRNKNNQTLIDFFKATT